MNRNLITSSNNGVKNQIDNYILKHLSDSESTYIINGSHSEFNKLIRILWTLFLRGLICVSYIKTAVKNVKYHRGVPCTPLMINQGGGKKSGGWEAQGGPSHPPDFDSHPPGPPLKPPLGERLSANGENLIEGIASLIVEYLLVSEI